jgi:hypothetical protein
MKRYLLFAASFGCLCAVLDSIHHSVLLNWGYWASIGQIIVMVLGASERF